LYSVLSLNEPTLAISVAIENAASTFASFWEVKSRKVPLAERIYLSLSPREVHAKPLAPDVRKIEFVESFQSDFAVLVSSFAVLVSSHLHVISDFQKLSLTPDPNHLLIPRHPVPREGTLAIVTDVGAGSGGRGSCD
jgi:hypothetical protein